MTKIKTFTLDKGNGEQDLIDTSMESIKCEIELDDDKDVIEVTIRIEKKYSQRQIEKLPDYTG